MPMRSSIRSLILGAAILVTAFAITPATACPWTPFHKVAWSTTVRAGASITSLERYPGHVDLFAIGNDGRVYTTSLDGDPSVPVEGLPWAPISSAGTGISGREVTAIARRPNQIDLFLVGHDGKIYTRSWTDGAGTQWYDAGPWSPISVATTASLGATTVAAVSRHPWQIELFVVGNDGKIYTRAWIDGAGTQWFDAGPWYPISTPGTSHTAVSVTAISRIPEQIDLFAVGNDGRVYTQWWNDYTHTTWYDQGPWLPISAQSTASGRVTAVSRRPSQMELFVVGGDGRVYEQWWNDGEGVGWYAAAPWHGVSPVMAAPASRVTAVSRRQQLLELYVVANDGAVWSQWWDDTLSSQHNWFWQLPWNRVNGSFSRGATVTAQRRSDARVDLFVAGYDGAVWSATWSDADAYFPHYVLATLVYAPPGKGSHADYTTGSTTGTRIEIVETRGGGIDLQVEGFGLDLETKWILNTEDGTSAEVKKSTGHGVTVNSQSDLLHHDYDTYFLWTNPQLDICSNGIESHQKWSVAGGPTATIVDVTAGELAGRTPMPTWKAAALANLTREERDSLLSLDPWMASSTPQLDPNRFAFVDTLPLNGPASEGGTYVGQTESVGYDQSTGTIKGNKNTGETVALAGTKIFGFGAKGGFVWNYEYEKTTESTVGKQQMMSVVLQTTTVAFHLLVDLYYDAVFGTYAYVPNPRQIGRRNLPPIWML